MFPNEYEELYKELNHRILEFTELCGIMPRAIYLGAHSAAAIEIYAGNLNLYKKKNRTFKSIPIYIIHGIQHNKYIGVGL